MLLKEPVKRVQACFLSKQVCDPMLIDDTVDHFVVDDPDHHFGDIVGLMNSEVVNITSSNVDFLENVANKVENLELLKNSRHEIESSIDIFDCINLRTRIPAVVASFNCQRLSSLVFLIKTTTFQIIAGEMTNAFG